MAAALTTAASFSTDLLLFPVVLGSLPHDNNERQQPVAINSGNGPAARQQQGSGYTTLSNIKTLASERQHSTAKLLLQNNATSGSVATTPTRGLPGGKEANGLQTPQSNND